MLPHAFTRKIANYFYCARCGLVALKNERTRKRIQQGCAE